jgi:hypothetical protein
MDYFFSFGSPDLASCSSQFHCLGWIDFLFSSIVLLGHLGFCFCKQLLRLGATLSATSLIIPIHFSSHNNYLYRWEKLPFLVASKADSISMEWTRMCQVVENRNGLSKKSSIYNIAACQIEKNRKPKSDLEGLSCRFVPKNPPSHPAPGPASQSIQHRKGGFRKAVLTCCSGPPSVDAVATKTG